MNALASAKPAAEDTANGLQRDDRFERLIGSIANPSFPPTQGAYRLVRAHWVVVRQNNGWRRSIPVFIRRPVLPDDEVTPANRRRARAHVRAGGADV
jgi:hypothetical protein